MKRMKYSCAKRGSHVIMLRLWQ